MANRMTAAQQTNARQDKIFETAKALKAPRTGDAEISTLCIVAMSLTKETPGTFRYDASDPNAAVTSCYIRKAAITDDAPKNISVTVHTA